MAVKKYFKCKICGDIHYGAAGPVICPTCGHEKAYLEVKKEDALKLMK